MGESLSRRISEKLRMEHERMKYQKKDEGTEMDSELLRLARAAVETKNRREERKSRIRELTDNVKRNPGDNEKRELLRKLEEEEAAYKKRILEYGTGFIMDTRFGGE